MLSFGGFFVSRLQTDTLDVSELFCWIHGQIFYSATEILEISDVKAEKHSEESNVTSVFGAVEKEPLQDLGTEHILQNCLSAISIQVYGNADFRVLDTFQRLFDGLTTPFYSYWPDPG